MKANALIFQCAAIIASLTNICYGEKTTDDENNAITFAEQNNYYVRRVEQGDKKPSPALFQFRYEQQQQEEEYDEEEQQKMRKAEEDNHIVGGTEAAVGEFPFYVEFEGDILCGGSLIAPNRVLTAGHCVQETGAPPAVRINPTSDYDGEVIPVTCAVLHPSYSTAFVTVVNDVAVLKLAYDVNFTATKAQLVHLNNNASFPDIAGTDLTVIGFGLTSSTATVPSTTLRKVNTHFVPTQQCQATYNDIIVRPVAHICADVYGRGDCNGDSGGPLIDAVTKTQVGLVSFGYGGCANNQYEDVYTRVSTYYDWIQEQILSDNETCPAIKKGLFGGTVRHVCSLLRLTAQAAIEKISIFFANGN